MRPGSWVEAAGEASESQQNEPFSHRGQRSRDVVREMKGKRKGAAL